MVGSIKSGRRTAARGGFGLAVVACAGALALAGQATAATTAYPGGGSNFDDGTQGWTGSDTSCTFPLLPASLCSSVNGHDPGGGNPGGAIHTQATVIVNLLGLFNAQGTWTSPPFTVPAGTPVTGATFQYDRRFQAGGLLALDPDVTVAAELVDDTAVAVTPLLGDDPQSSETFETRSAGVPGGAVVPGRTYRLRLRSTISSSVASIGLLGTSTLAYDNVRLSVTDGTSTGGPNPGGNGGNGGDGGNSPGVRVVRGPYSDAEIASILRRFNINADSGSGRDGSLIPLELCTIVGTSGPDRINGTAGNDVICGLGGDDTITSSGGRDAIDGADGNDRLSGGIAGDLLLGLRGNDRLDGGGDGDRIGGGAGDDRIEAGNGTDTASGGSGKDAVGGEAGNDTLGGLAGNDRINGGPGRDRLGGGAGSDVLRGFSGNDRLDGGSGNDRLDGGSGRDALAAGSGADRILARDASRDTIDGGRGRDRAVADRVDRISQVPVVSRR